MLCYCLFCETGRTELIAQYVRRVYQIKAIVPKVIQRKWVKGEKFDEPHPMLPGYLFLYSDTEIRRIEGISGVIRILGNQALTGSDLVFAMMLYRLDGVLGTIQVRDLEGVLEPVDDFGAIRKVDRGRERLLLEYEFDGDYHSLWVGYDVISSGENSDINRA